MSLELLFELLEISTEIKAMKPAINTIAKKLFHEPAGPVKDLKRSKEAKYFGVVHTKSIFRDARDKSVHLTFDNSTDSGEFEINSLVPMLIKKGSPTDKALKALYKEFDIKSSKKLNYIIHGDDTVLREIHLGKNIDENTVKMVAAAIAILQGKSVEKKPKDDEEKEPPKKVVKKTDEAE